MTVFQLGVPRKPQIVHGAERVLVVFVVAALTVWQTQPDKFTKAAGLAAVAAGFTALVQLVISTLTTL